MKKLATYIYNSVSTSLMKASAFIPVSISIVTNHELEDVNSIVYRGLINKDVKKELTRDSVMDGKYKSDLYLMAKVKQLNILAGTLTTLMFSTIVSYLHTRKAVGDSLICHIELLNSIAFGCVYGMVYKPLLTFMSGIGVITVDMMLAWVVEFRQVLARSNIFYYFNIICVTSMLMSSFYLNMYSFRI